MKICFKCLSGILPRKSSPQHISYSNLDSYPLAVHKEANPSSSSHCPALPVKPRALPKNES